MSDGKVYTWEYLDKLDCNSLESIKEVKQEELYIATQDKERLKVEILYLQKRIKEV